MRIDTTVPAPWRVVTQQVMRTLRAQGLEARRTFDLRMARASMRNGETVPCPHHRGEPCTCQYLVFHVRGKGEWTMVVIIHGHDRLTGVSILTDSGVAADPAVAAIANDALERFRRGRSTRHGGNGMEKEPQGSRREQR